MKRSRQGLFGGKPQLRRHRRRSPLMLVGGLVTTLVVVLVGGVIFLLPRLQSHAAGADPNMNCTLIVPANPLTAQGLAKPYQLVATDPAKGACHEANPTQAAFVQAGVIDPVRGNIAIYNPLVVDKGTQPALAPVLPNLPHGAVVGIWFGYNGN